MSKEFMADEWHGLTNDERASLWRRLAKEAERAAQFVHPKLQEDVKHIAGQWKLLAAEIEPSR